MPTKNSCYQEQEVYCTAVENENLEPKPLLCHSRYAGMTFLLLLMSHSSQKHRPFLLINQHLDRVGALQADADA
jgi:hypothetical protein